MAKREFWFTQTWSARKRQDGTLEPDAPIGGIGIGPEAENVEQSGPLVRHISSQLGKPPGNAPFFIVQGKFTLFPAISRPAPATGAGR